MEKKQTDKKMVVGMIILLAVLVVIGGSFWSVVGSQAQKVKEEEARAEETALTAIYIETGELLKRQVFVDMENGTVFTADIPSDGIYNKKGKLIPDDVLEDGDMVKIYGDGIMTRSLPGKYTNVTKMQRVGRAALEEAQKYREKVEDIIGK
ncbi:MAG: hypothetical protein Q4D16_09145 [Eubacteriales bacterium]|nr:hypothetical protein [Eubacteriales bacterium]